MGAACCRPKVVFPPEENSTLGVMFQRIDKDKKGYIDLNDLQALMHDDFKAYFRGHGAEHIMQKYGQDGKLSFENFQVWWGSTYTTYNNEEALSRMVDEALEEGEDDDDDDASETMEQVGELHARKNDPKRLPSNKNVAVSRS